MHIGEAQRRNVESRTTTPAASASTQIVAPSPASPPSTCSPVKVTDVEAVTVTYAVAATGATVRSLTTIRVEERIAIPAIVAPGSPRSVMSASGPPRPVIATGAYAPGASVIESPGSASAMADASSASPATRTVPAAAEPTAASEQRATRNPTATLGNMRP